VEGVPQIRLAEEYGVGRSTITDLKRTKVLVLVEK